MQYFFELGATSALSLLELHSLLGNESIKQINDKLVSIELATDSDARKLMEKLGGVVKISKKIDNQEKLISKHAWKEWIRRDRNKPYADHKKGMLPPKVARMMVNIAIGQYQIQNHETAQNLLDPFCGTGTVLMEALLLRLNVYGSDIDSDAAFGSHKNLAWLKRQYQIKNTYKVFQKDATKITTQDLAEKVQLLVTEPFLGKPRPNLSQLPNIFKGLEKLYLGSFKNWSKILDENAILVVVFPSCETENKSYNLAHLIDKLRSFGYSTLSGPVVYARPEAIIKRQIYVLKYVTR